MRVKIIMLLLLGALAGCAAPAKVTQSQMEIQSYQSHEFEATKRVAFDATMSVLQDSGFIIASADYQTGFITGTGTSKSHMNAWWGAMNEHVKMTAFIEQRTSKIARVRVNLVETSQRKSAWNPAQDVINESGVRDPETYQHLFKKIDSTIFIKKNL